MLVHGAYPLTHNISDFHGFSDMIIPLIPKKGEPPREAEA